MGTTKDSCIPMLSATAPCKRGIKAPPKTAMISNEEPWLVYLPKPVMARVKMLDHMIELNSPMLMIAHIAVLPLLKITKSKRIKLAKAKIESVRAGADLPIKKANRFKPIRPMKVLI